MRDGHNVGRAPNHRGQHGDVTVELALTAPLYLLLTLGVVQLALWLHAVNTATTAAQEGVRAARVLGGTAQDGQRTAEVFLAQLGGHLTNPRVQATRTASTASVEITAHTTAALFGLTLPVRATAQSPVERFLPEDAGFAGSQQPSGHRPNPSTPGRRDPAEQPARRGDPHAV